MMSIEFRPEEIIDWLVRVKANKDSERDRFLADLAVWIENIMEMEAPMLTGALRNRITSTIIDNMITVWPDIWYAKYVVMDVPPSLGRYIPLLGKRLIDDSRKDIGMHPGHSANLFVDRTFKYLLEHIDDFIDDYLDRVMQF